MQRAHQHVPRLEVKGGILVHFALLFHHLLALQDKVALVVDEVLLVPLLQPDGLTFAVIVPVHDAQAHGAVQRQVVAVKGEIAVQGEYRVIADVAHVRAPQHVLLTRIDGVKHASLAVVCH